MKNARRALQNAKVVALRINFDDDGQSEDSAISTVESGINSMAGASRRDADWGGNETTALPRQGRRI